MYRISLALCFLFLFMYGSVLGGSSFSKKKRTPPPPYYRPLPPVPEGDNRVSLFLVYIYDLLLFLIYIIYMDSFDYYYVIVTTK